MLSGKNGKPNLIATACNLIEPNSNGLRPNGGLQPSSDGLQPNSQVHEILIIEPPPVLEVPYRAGLPSTS